MIKCPVCRAPYRETSPCPRCQTDLLPLLEIRNHALRCYNDALEQAQAAHWTVALEKIDQAIAHFQNQGEFHLLRGKILAHLRQYPGACQAWHMALHYDPSLTAAQTCLTTFSHLLNRIARTKEL